MSLKDLDNRIKKAQRQAKTHGVKPKKNITSGADLGMGMKIASDLIAGILVGIFVGFNLDKYLETKPLFVIVFVFLGFIAGMNNVYRTAQKMEESRKDKAQQKLNDNKRK